jgi:predicted dehydrogenase
MNMINYGMIGCGMMGHEHLQNIALLGGTNISVIFEPDSGMARSAVMLAPNAMLVRSLDELLDTPNLDCLVISSPNYCHLEQMLRIAQKNPLPLLVEKPLFTSVDDQILILEFSKTYPAPVWVAMEYRYMPPIAAFLEKVDSVTGGVKCLQSASTVFHFSRKLGIGTVLTIKQVVHLLRNAAISLILCA